jgi:hypothetical protein
VKLALVFPPLADATQPYSSLPALAAVARRAGHEVTLHDANLAFVRELLTAERVEAAGEALRRYVDALAAGPPPAGPETAAYARRVQSLLRAPLLAAGVEAAVAALGRDETFRDLGRLSAAKRTVDEALELHAAAWPEGLAAGAPEVPELCRPAALADWAADAARNPFLDHLERVTLPELAAAAPRVVGISVTYRSQVLPAVTLARLVRRRLPGVSVVLGGSMASRWHDGIEACPEIFDGCDYLVGFEGESPLVALLDVLGAEPDPDAERLAAVPNLAFRRGGRVVRTPLAWEDVDALPTPDYRGLPLDRYLAPRPVFLLATSRGCYWRRCAFCSVSPATRARYRARRPDLVHADVAALVARHGARCISFGDDCVSPSTLRALAARLRRHGPAVSWQCEARFESALTAELLAELAAAGCKNLIFGFESAAPRVLGLMGKGVRPAEVPRILADCRRAGIACNLQFFFGFPGETAAEAEATADFVRGEMHGAATFSFGTFELQKGAAVERDPGAFGIGRVERGIGPLAVRYDYAPPPEHAPAVRARLLADLRKRTRHRHAGLSINAHTLLFLDAAGVEALGGLYGEEEGAGEPEPLEPAELMELPLRPGPHQAVAEVPWTVAETENRTPRGEEAGGAANAGTTATGSGVLLLYDHDLDRTAEVPRLALWLLHHLDGETSPATLAARLAAATGEDPSVTTATIARLTAELHLRGFLHVETCPRPTTA